MFQWARSATRTRAVNTSRAYRTHTNMASDAKKDFRKEIKNKLKQLSEDEITEQSRKAQHLILNLKQYKEAQTLSVYLAMPKAEAQTSQIVSDALHAGKQVFIPYIHQPRTGPKIIDMLRLASVAEFEGLERDSWGIPSLPADSVEARENAMGGKGLSSGEHPPETEDGEGRKDEGTLDLVVMPGVAFDQGMNRLGHGRGFYDAYLSRFCADGTRKPYLGKSNSICVVGVPLTERLCSRVVSCRAAAASGTGDSHDVFGLDRRCDCCRRWDVDDFG